MRLLAIIIAPILICQSVWSQENPQDKTASNQVQDSQSRFLSSHDLENEQLIDLVEGYMLLSMRNALDLTDSQILELVQKLGTYKKELTRLKFREGIVSEQLRQKIVRGVSEDLIKADLDVLIKTGSGIAKELRSMIEESKKVLSTTQSAQLYLFVDDFEQEILQLVEKAQKMHQQDIVGSDDANDGKPDEELTSGLRELVQVETRRLDMPDNDEKDIIDLVDAWMMIKMMKTLDLPNDQFVSLMKHVGQYRDQLYQLKWQVAESRLLLRRRIGSGAHDGILSENLEDLLLQEEAVAQLVESFVKAAQKDVSVTLSAKMLLFMIDFEEEVRELIGKASYTTH